MVGPQEAEDLAQVTFAKASQRLADFRDESDISTWLHRVAINVALDWLRSRPARENKVTIPLADVSAEHNMKEFTGAIVETPLTPEQELSHKDTQECLRNEIAKLPELYREALALSFLAQLDDQQIADALGITLTNAKVRLHRARQEFKKMIEARCDFYKDEFSCKPASSDCCETASTPAD
jgi:RNA polymerase sigma-70 factor, ECF subfamily